jgi:hypothetical protein
MKRKKMERKMKKYSRSDIGKTDRKGPNVCKGSKTEREKGARKEILVYRERAKNVICEGELWRNMVHT